MSIFEQVPPPPSPRRHPSMPTTTSASASASSVAVLAASIRPSSHSLLRHQSSLESCATGNASRGNVSATASATFLPHQIVPAAPKSVATTIRWDLLYPDEPVAIQIITQSYLPPGATSWKRRLGWVGVVNSIGQTVFDPFATYPKEPGLKKTFSNKRYGAIKEDLLFRRGARDGKDVERDLIHLLHGRTVVVHGTQTGADDFYFQSDAFGESLVHDIQKWHADLHLEGTPSLYAAVRTVLHKEVHKHDIRRPDADAALMMELYLRQMPYDRRAKQVEWEAQAWTPEMTRDQAKPKRPKQRNDSKHGSDRQFSNDGLGFNNRPSSTKSSINQSQTLDAGAQFALRLKRRHFAEVQVREIAP